MSDRQQSRELYRRACEILPAGVNSPVRAFRSVGGDPLHHDEVLKQYEVGLGFAPVGHKEKKGDGRTPEGEYFIDRHNPNSEFFPRTSSRSSTNPCGTAGSKMLILAPRKAKVLERSWVN